jgi:hypothetical protein
MAGVAGAVSLRLGWRIAVSPTEAQFGEEAVGWLFVVVVSSEAVGALAGAMRRGGPGLAPTVFRALVGAAIAGSLVDRREPLRRHDPPVRPPRRPEQPEAR